LRASAGNIAKGHLVLQKSLDGRFIGRVEHRTAGPAAARDFETQRQGRKALVAAIRRSVHELEALAILVAELSQPTPERLDVRRIERGVSRLEHADPVDLSRLLGFGGGRGEEAADGNNESDQAHAGGEFS